MQTSQSNEQTEKKVSYGLEPNVASAICYLFPPFTGVAFYIIEKKNKFVRFNALQSMLFGVVWIAGSMIAQIIPIVSIILTPIISIAFVIYWLLLMWHSFNNKEYLLPKLGEIAKKYT